MNMEAKKKDLEDGFVVLTVEYQDKIFANKFNPAGMDIMDLADTIERLSDGLKKRLQEELLPFNK